MPTERIQKANLQQWLYKLKQTPSITELAFTETQPARRPARNGVRGARGARVVKSYHGRSISSEVIYCHQLGGAVCRWLDFIQQLERGWTLHLYEERK